MSDHLPLVEVPESTWLRALAHALDPEAESADESLIPDDDEPVSASSDEPAAEADGDDDSDDDASAAPSDVDVHVWDTDDEWSPADDGSDTPGVAHHDDDGIV